jgi:hypothetical protein
MFREVGIQWFWSMVCLHADEKKPKIIMGQTLKIKKIILIYF